MKPSRSHHSSSCNSSFRARRSRNPVDLHRYPEAEAQTRAADALTGDDPAANVALIRGIADPAQRVRRAVQILEASQASGGLTQGLVRAAFLMRLDERDRALKLLDDAAANGTAIPQLLWFHVFDPVRNDPRFKAALKKMGLPYTPRDVPTQ